MVLDTIVPVMFLDAAQYCVSVDTHCYLLHLHVIDRAPSIQCTIIMLVDLVLTHIQCSSLHFNVLGLLAM